MKLPAHHFLLLTIIAAIILAGCSSQIAQPAPTLAATQTPAADLSAQISLTATAAETPQINPQPFEIQLAWFYKPPAASPADLVTDYDFFILTHNDEAFRDELKKQGVATPVLQYLLLNEIMDPGSCDASPYNDQVAFKPGDFCWIKDNHPDWFLTGKDGNLLGPSNYYMMDSGNPGWQNFWLERASLLQETYHWDGIFLDNVEASRSKIAEWGKTPGAYPTDERYQAAIENELKILYTQYFHPMGKPVFANIIAVEDPQVWLRYLQYLDGAMIENFATGWPGGTGLSVSEWEQQILMVQQAQAMGKTVILVAQGDQYDQQRQEFALGSYLLVSDGLAYFRYTNHSNYEQIWPFANQTIDLGAALGACYQDGSNWRRDFNNGTVLVNPTAQTASVTLK
jgi:hypothetical protein